MSRTLSIPPPLRRSSLQHGRLNTSDDERQHTHLPPRSATQMETIFALHTHTANHMSAARIPPSSAARQRDAANTAAACRASASMRKSNSTETTTQRSADKESESAADAISSSSSLHNTVCYNSSSEDITSATQQQQQHTAAFDETADTTAPTTPSVGQSWWTHNAAETSVTAHDSVTHRRNADAQTRSANTAVSRPAEPNERGRVKESVRGRGCGRATQSTSAHDGAMEDDWVSSCTASSVSSQTDGAKVVTAFTDDCLGPRACSSSTTGMHEVGAAMETMSEWPYDDVHHSVTVSRSSSSNGSRCGSKSDGGDDGSGENSSSSRSTSKSGSQHIFNQSKSSAISAIDSNLHCRQLAAEKDNVVCAHVSNHSNNFDSHDKLDVYTDARRSETLYSSQTTQPLAPTRYTDTTTLSPQNTESGPASHETHHHKHHRTTNHHFVESAIACAQHRDAAAPAAHTSKLFSTPACDSDETHYSHPVHTGSALFCATVPCSTTKSSSLSSSSCTSSSPARNHEIIKSETHASCSPMCDEATHTRPPVQTDRLSYNPHAPHVKFTFPVDAAGLDTVALRESDAHLSAPDARSQHDTSRAHVNTSAHTDTPNSSFPTLMHDSSEASPIQRPKDTFSCPTHSLYSLLPHETHCQENPYSSLYTSSASHTPPKKPTDSPHMSELQPRCSSISISNDDHDDDAADKECHNNDNNDTIKDNSNYSDNNDYDRNNSNANNYYKDTRPLTHIARADTRWRLAELQRQLQLREAECRRLGDTVHQLRRQLVAAAAAEEQRVQSSMAQAAAKWKLREREIDADARRACEEARRQIAAAATARAALTAQTQQWARIEADGRERESALLAELQRERAAAAQTAAELAAQRRAVSASSQTATSATAAAAAAQRACERSRAECRDWQQRAQWAERRVAELAESKERVLRRWEAVEEEWGRARRAWEERVVGGEIAAGPCVREEYAYRVCDATKSVDTIRDECDTDMKTSIMSSTNKNVSRINDNSHKVDGGRESFKGHDVDMTYNRAMSRHGSNGKENVDMGEEETKRSAEVNAPHAQKGLHVYEAKPRMDRAGSKESYREEGVSRKSQSMPPSSAAPSPTSSASPSPMRLYSSASPYTKLSATAAVATCRQPNMASGSYRDEPMYSQRSWRQPIWSIQREASPQSFSMPRVGTSTRQSTPPSAAHETAGARHVPHAGDTELFMQRARHDRVPSLPVSAYTCRTHNTTTNNKNNNNHRDSQTPGKPCTQRDEDTEHYFDDPDELYVRSRHHYASHVRTIHSTNYHDTNEQKEEEKNTCTVTAAMVQHPYATEPPSAAPRTRDTAKKTSLALPTSATAASALRVKEDGTSVPQDVSHVKSYSMAEMHASDTDTLSDIERQVQAVLRCYTTAHATRDDALL